MSGQELSEEEYNTPAKRENALKKLIIDAIIALRQLYDVSKDLVDQATNTTIQHYIDNLVRQYFQITQERVDGVRPDAAGPAVTGDMPFGGRRRIHKSSVQRRKHHHSNKKGKTVRRKMTRTRR